MNLNFLTEQAQKEFVKLYGEKSDNPYDILNFAEMKSEMNFDKIHTIIFEIIDAVFECKWHNFNLDFARLNGRKRENKYYYRIVFYLEDIDFEYSPDGLMSTTEYGIQLMNENFKFKEMCKIERTYGDEIEVKVIMEE